MDMGKEERVRFMGSVTWKLTILYVKKIADVNSLYDSANSNMGSVTI